MPFLVKCVKFFNFEVEIFENKEMCRFWRNVLIFSTLEAEIFERKKNVPFLVKCFFVFPKN